ncbi:MFS transporter [Microlunatus flavus]|uniref:Predicted arabinose efflux permease, MFS family n=1 Tax=Microlunatus flavus TaxID=1036181 RepID=A0A1H9EQJ3_9ACTN|nr:MFS transporter [Microlunatus flavus]SEQ27268.1 Predicted arabinose efflux permease, MFS family [Microlunatus flavus]
MTDGSSATARTRAAGWSPWRAVVGFGVVSLTADMVYEGARSVTGPLLATLGASALLVGLVTGAGEAVALVLRLFTGTWADRSGRYWTLTLAGYALTAVCVPLLAVTPFLAGAGLASACVLVLAERTGKAVRSPAKSTLLAAAAGQVGMGRGMAVHKALDQLGAVAGPLLVAGVAALAGTLWPAFAVLVVPGAVAIVVLLVLRRRLEPPAPKPPAPKPPAPSATVDAAATPVTPALTGAAARRLPQVFWLFAASAGAATAGLVTFGVISFHLTEDRVVPVAAVPLVYAAAMAAEAVAALATGWVYDHVGGRVLVVLPFLVALVPPLAFTRSVPLVLVGVLVWGAAMGVQDSTVKALVADLVPSGRRATAYGVFAAVQGAAAVAGGAAAGALYERSLPGLVIVVAATQVVTLVLLVTTLRKVARPASAGDYGAEHRR